MKARTTPLTQNAEMNSTAAMRPRSGPATVNSIASPPGSHFLSTEDGMISQNSAPSPTKYCDRATTTSNALLQSWRAPSWKIQYACAEHKQSGENANRTDDLAALNYAERWGLGF